MKNTLLLFSVILVWSLGLIISEAHGQLPPCVPGGGCLYGGSVTTINSSTQRVEGYAISYLNYQAGLMYHPAVEGWLYRTDISAIDLDYRYNRGYSSTTSAQVFLSTNNYVAGRTYCTYSRHYLVSREYIGQHIFGGDWQDCKTIPLPPTPTPTPTCLPLADGTLPPCPSPTPTPISVAIRDTNGNVITGTEQVVMLGVPTRLEATSNYSNATFTWSAPNGNVSSGTGNIIRVSWATTGTYTVSLTATSGQLTTTVQSTIRVQSPIFDKLEATETVPVLYQINGCSNSDQVILSLGCVNNNPRGITITGSAKAPTGSISSDREAKMKFVQLVNPYRTKLFSEGEKYCLTERTSQTDLSTGWKLDGQDPYANEGIIVDGIPAIANFSRETARARIGDSPSSGLTGQTEQFIADAFETFVVYYVQAVDGAVVQRVLGKLPWDWQAKAVKENNQYVLKTAFSKPAVAVLLAGEAVPGDKINVSDVRPYTGVGLDIPYVYCGPPRQLDSMFVSQQVPLTVSTNTNFSVSVTMRNTGTITWTRNNFSLVRNSILMSPELRVAIEDVTQDIATGQTATFTFVVKSPSTAGTYSTSWIMADFSTGSTNTFGQVTPPKNIQVVQSASPTPTPGFPSDLTIWRPDGGVWWVLNGSVNGSNTSQYSLFSWGTNGDVPVPGDYDGDGKTDFAIFRPSTGVWWITYSSTGGSSSVQFGLNGDKPTPADYDGDGKTDTAVFRQNDPSPGYGTFYVIKSLDSTSFQIQFGLSSDIPVSADYDGDGKADLAVYRQSNQFFYVFRSSDGQVQYQTLGLTGSGIPVSGDYDGDGKADFAVKEGNIWLIKESFTGSELSYLFKDTSDLPVQHDYDGDGILDIAVWRPLTGDWYIRQSSNASIRQVRWGQPGDSPVPAFYRR